MTDKIFWIYMQYWNFTGLEKVLVTNGIRVQIILLESLSSHYILGDMFYQWFCKKVGCLIFQIT